MTTGSGWNNASKIEIHNSDRILGMGGNGAQGGVSGAQNYWYPGFQGQKGGDAIAVLFPVTINNIGIIFSGGGGGQGYGTSSGGPVGSCIAGYSTGRTAGTNGNINSIGYGGNSGYSAGFTSGAGGNGGTWGSPGNDSAWSTAGAPWGNGYPTAGGAAGIAIKSNGHVVTWLSGNNSSQVRGPIN